MQGQDIVIATHSPHFLGLPDWTLTHLRREEGRVSLNQVSGSERKARSALARDLGYTRGELLAGINYLLVVEGPQDAITLDTLFGRELREHGVAVVRMFGTDNLLATAELDFIDRYLDVPVGILLDYVRADGTTSRQPKTEEEFGVAELRQRLPRHRKNLHIHGLRRPDITAYLSEAAIRDRIGPFPGWGPVLERFTKIKKRPSFKPWLQKNYNVDFTTTGAVREVLEDMKARCLHPHGELTAVVNQILLASDPRPDRTAESATQG
jgi:hypothetical protein